MTPLEKQIAFEALLKAFEILGGPSAIAKKLQPPIKPQSVDGWRKKLKRVPAEQVLQLEELVKGKVKCYEFRPDLYPRDRFVTITTKP